MYLHKLPLYGYISKIPINGEVHQCLCTTVTFSPRRSEKSWLKEARLGSQIDRTFKNSTSGTFLVVQWLRVHLPMQGTWVRALVREDPTCRGATKPVCHSCWVCALEPVSHNY